MKRAFIFRKLLIVQGFAFTLGVSACDTLSSLNLAESQQKLAIAEGVWIESVSTGSANDMIKDNAVDKTTTTDTSSDKNKSSNDNPDSNSKATPTNQNNLTISEGVWIENVSTGSANDTIKDNAVDKTKSSSSAPVVEPIADSVKDNQALKDEVPSSEISSPTPSESPSAATPLPTTTEPSATPMPTVSSIPSEPTSTPTPQSTPLAQTSHEVLFSQNQFSPENLTINLNDTIKWINQSSLLRILLSDDNLFSNQSLSKNGGSFSFKFTRTGVFTFSIGVNQFKVTVN